MTDFSGFALNLVGTAKQKRIGGRNHKLRSTTHHDKNDGSIRLFYGQTRNFKILIPSTVTFTDNLVLPNKFSAVQV